MDRRQNVSDRKCRANTMIKFTRYPHVRSLIVHYAKELNASDILKLMESDITSEVDALNFSQFIWKMLDQMAIDIKNKKAVLGNIDNSSMIPDIDYEVSLYLAERGFENIWDDVCDQN